MDLQPLLLAVVSGFFFGLLALFRFSVNTGFLDRPFAIGLLYALISGEWLLSLGVALFYELFWADAFPAGTYVPPHRILATFLTLMLASALEFNTAGQILPLLLPGLLLAWLGARMEIWLRMRQNSSYDLLWQWSIENGQKFKPEALVQKALAQLAAASAFLYFCSFLICYYSLQAIYSHWPWEFAAFTWQHLWSIGLLGAILSLRSRRAYKVLALGAALLIFFI